MKSMFLLVVFLGVVRNVVSIETTREMEGYPLGYLSDCPGVTKEAQISKRSLRHLYFYHLQEGSFLTANRTKYSYFRMKQLAPNLDFRKKTILFMTGYMDTLHMTPVSLAMGGMYTRNGYNVLLMEYIQFTAWLYPVAARLLRAVGKRTAEMLSTLTTLGLDPKKLELLGVSHGGQGVSFIGKNFRQITGKNISRITALDPSGPCFRRLGPKERIDASDADKVDIIHTNNEGFGYAGAVGHVNFYVNGGEYQIGDILELPCTTFCSHVKSYQLWVAAMAYPDSFIAFKCNTIQDARDRTCFDGPQVTNLLGPKTDFNVQGIFYLTTLNYYPYYLGKKGLVKDSLEKSTMLEVNKVDVLIV